MEGEGEGEGEGGGGGEGSAGASSSLESMGQRTKKPTNIKHSLINPFDPNKVVIILCEDGAEKG